MQAIGHLKFKRNPDVQLSASLLTALAHARLRIQHKQLSVFLSKPLSFLNHTWCCAHKRYARQ